VRGPAPISLPPWSMYPVEVIALRSGVLGLAVMVGFLRVEVSYYRTIQPRPKQWRGIE